MTFAALLLCSLAAALPAPTVVSSAGTADPALFNIKAKPLPKPQEFLLMRNRYQIHTDGSVWTPDGLTQVATAEVPDLMIRLASSQRLKALIQIDVILSASAGEKYLTPVEYEAIKKVARENWPYFTLTLRKNFRAYFSLEELERLNRDPAAVAAGEELAADMKDPEPAPVVEPPVETVAAARPTPEPAPRPLPSPFPRILQPAALQNVKPAALPAPAPAVAPHPVVAAAPPAPAPAEISAGRGPTIVAVPPPTPAPAPIAAPAHAAVPAPAPAPAVVPAPQQPTLVLQAPPPAAREIMQAEFEKWLLDAPYDRDGKAMLRLISEKAPAFARARVLDVVLNTMPMVVVDAARAGHDRYGAILSEERPGELAYTVALNPGLIVYTKKRFFGSSTWVLPQSPEIYKSLHLPVPELDALKRESVALREEPGDWGKALVYNDGSQRVSYTHQQLAGALLRELLLLSARRGGWADDRFAAELYARTAQNLFYAAVIEQLHDDRFLDPELRLDFHEWLEHPRDWHDRLAHTLASARAGAFEAALSSPENAEEFAKQQSAACPGSLSDEQTAAEAARRRAYKAEAAALRETELFSKEQADAAAKAVDAEPTPPALAPDGCARRWQDGVSAAQISRQLAAEMHQAESKFRKEKGLYARP